MGETKKKNQGGESQKRLSEKRNFCLAPREPLLSL